MGYQQGSIDISQIKAIALGAHDASVSEEDRSHHELAGALQSCVPPPSLQNLQARAATATENPIGKLPGGRLITVDLKQRHSTHTQKSNDTGRSASQMGLPGNVVSKVKMHSNSTPSTGDTQVASQWIYDEKTVDATIPARLHVKHDDTGHINFVDGFEQDLRADEESAMFVEDNEEDDVELVSQDIRAEPFPESRRFQQPLTPIVQGTKRKRPAEEEEEPALWQTPQLPTNPFAGLKASDMMRPSQIFQTTQAQTSPLVVQPDSQSERPSPNVNNFGRSSTVGPSSSPAMVRNSRSTINRTEIEPQRIYVSMKESQEARDRRLQEMPRKQVDPFDDEFENISHGHRNGVDREGQRIKIQASKTSLPPESNQSLNADCKATPYSRQSTTRRRGSQIGEAILISDDRVTEAMSDNITEDETEREEEVEVNMDDETDELAEENKENVEVPMTVSRLHHGQLTTSQHSPSSNCVTRGLRRPVARSATQVVGSPRIKTSPSREPMKESSTQPFAVRDSQSSQQNDVRELSNTVASSRTHMSMEMRSDMPQSQLLQKKKGSIPRYGMYSKAGTDVHNIQLLSSSPELFSAPQSVNLDARNGRTEELMQARVENGENKCPSNETVHHVDPQVCAEQHPSQTALQNYENGNSPGPDLKTRTIAETNLMVMKPTPVQKAVSNSSQVTSSSGQIPSSVSRITKDHSADGQSLGTTPYETAPDHFSKSPSKCQVQRVQADFLEESAPLPTKRLQRRSLGEIVAEPSPPDAVEDVSLSDFGLLSKEDEEFHAVVHGRVYSNGKSSKRTTQTSTKWKASTSDLIHASKGTPSRPTSSAISVPTPLEVSSEAEAEAEAKASSSSPLSSPPSSGHEERISRADEKAVLERRDTKDTPSVGAPIPSSALQSSGPDREFQYLEHRTSMKGDMMVPAKNRSIGADHAGSVQNRGSHKVFTTPSDLPVAVPDRVFAHFNGNPSAFYSATCLGIIAGDEPRYSVHYDDGAEDIISAFGIKRLEFRPGDVVKVDLPAYRTKIWVVIGMQAKQDVQDPDELARLRATSPNDRGAWPETDIYGFTKVLLAPKQANALDPNQGVGEMIAVEMYHIYFTQAMWANIKDREYVYVSRRADALEGSQSPTSRPSNPSSPFSRAKRLKTYSHIRSSSMSGPRRGLFSNMIFTLTNIHQPADLERTKSLIVAHGGKVLEDGFDPLFHVPILHRITSPKKSDSDRVFHLTRESQNFGFTCLIADKHCRRAKYVQALALGLPCLATRWINDCITKQLLLPCSAYLLPAGESSFLGGATHSRVLPPMSVETATLPILLDQRPCMLKGASVLLIMSKNEEASMKQHPLLIFALGPARVARALSIEAAAKAVVEAHAVGKPWDWIFSYDREREVERALFGTAKKRKSRTWSGGQEVRTRVIGNEFIIQSLISGQLVED